METPRGLHDLIRLPKINLMHPKDASIELRGRIIEIYNEVHGRLEKFLALGETTLNEALAPHPLEKITEKNTRFRNQAQAEILSFLMNYLKPGSTPTEFDYIFLVNEVLGAPFHLWFKNLCCKGTPRIKFVLLYKGQPRRILNEMVEAHHLDGKNLQEFLTNLQEQYRQKFEN